MVDAGCSRAGMTPLRLYRPVNELYRGLPREAALGWKYVRVVNGKSVDIVSTALFFVNSHLRDCRAAEVPAADRSQSDH